MVYTSFGCPWRASTDSLATPRRSAESRGGAPSRLRRVSGEVGITMMLDGNISERTNTLSLEIFNAVSHADFDAANALCLLLSLFAAVIFLAAELLIRRSPRL